MFSTRALLSGAAGSVVLTAVHQAARLVVDAPPRMDLLGMRALAQLIRGAGAEPPDGDTLYATTFAGDLAGNALFYSFVATGEEGTEWARGVGLGLAAGIGGVVLPPVFGLSAAPSARTPATAVMTVAWYTLGGLAAAAVARGLRR